MGGALGFVYAPCAGPILAAVVAAGATGGTTGRIVAVAVAYGVGSGVVLFALAVGGRKLFERVKRVGRGPALQRALGVVLVLTAVAMGTQLDVRFQTALADHLPQFVVNPTGGIERSAAAQDRLADVRGKARFDRATADAKPVGAAGGRQSKYLDLGPRPGFEGGGTMAQHAKAPVSLRRLRGRVVLIDFWTYTCINCIRTLPQLRTLDARYRERGPERGRACTRPSSPSSARPPTCARPSPRTSSATRWSRTTRYDIWNAYGNQYWPAKYLIDARGRVRYTHFGEGGEKATESAIRALLVESGDRRLGARAKEARAIKPGAGMQTPETYFGAKRAQGWLVPPAPGTRTYRGPGRPPAERVRARRALEGHRRVGHRRPRRHGQRPLPRPARVPGAALGGPAPRARVRRAGGRQARCAPSPVRGDDIYTAVDLPEAGDHDLKLDFAPGVSGYAFTFG